MCVCVCAGVTAGGIGSFIGTPAEISLIRMTSDGRSVYTHISYVYMHQYCVLIYFIHFIVLAYAGIVVLFYLLVYIEHVLHLACI